MQNKIRLSAEGQVTQQNKERLRSEFLLSLFTSTNNMKCLPGSLYLEQDNGDRKKIGPENVMRVLRRTQRN